MPEEQGMQHHQYSNQIMEHIIQIENTGKLEVNQP